ADVPAAHHPLYRGAAVSFRTGQGLDNGSRDHAAARLDVRTHRTPRHLRVLIPPLIEEIERVAGEGRPRCLPRQLRHRITFQFTPRHASWRDQVEIWSSILARTLLRRGNFS